MGFMCDQSQHDEIGVLSVNAVSRVGCVVGLCPHFAYMLHNLVLAFPGDVVSGKDYRQSVPGGVFLDFFANKVLYGVGDLGEELGTGGYAVGIEHFPLVAFLILQIFGSFSHVHGGAKASGTLLVEFGSGRDTVNGHVDRDFGFDNLRNDAIQVCNKMGVALYR